MFEHNTDAITIATMPKIRQRTKYINGKLALQRAFGTRKDIHSCVIDDRTDGKLIDDAFRGNRIREIENQDHWNTGY